MTAQHGWVVQTPAKEKPYKVILVEEGGSRTEHPVATMREGEALIRRETPTAAGRNTLRDAPSLKVYANAAVSA
jgi:hypothetical protein